MLLKGKNAVVYGGGGSIGGRGDLQGTPLVDLTETPVLVGGASPGWTIDASNRIADLLLNGRCQVLDGQEHVVPPEVLAPVLEQFFGRARGLRRPR